MDEPTQTTFTDMFKNSFLNMFPETVDPWQLVTVLAVSLLLGLCIYAVYRRCFMGVVYDHSFAISLVIMTVLVSVIIVTISSNVMLSLGMVGALSIVRYRTAVKSPLDLMFLFWAITTGIAVGATYYYIGIVAFLFVAVVFFVLRNVRGGSETYMLVLECSADLPVEEEVRRALASYQTKVRSKVVRMASSTMDSGSDRASRISSEVTSMFLGRPSIRSRPLMFITASPSNG